MGRRYFLALAVLCLLGAFWLRVGDLHATPRGMNNDEASNLMRAWKLSVGDGMPLFFEDRPEPFHTILLAGFLVFVPVSAFTGRLFSVFVGMLSIAAVAPVARFVLRSTRQGNVVGILAMVVLATMPTAMMLQRSLYRANFVLLFSLLAFAALLYAARQPQHRHAFVAGVLVACSVMFYLSGVFFLPIAGVLVLVTWRGWTPQKLATLGAGFALAMLPYIYLFLTIPDWLGGRTRDVPAVYPWTDLEKFAGNYAMAWQRFIDTNAVFFENVRYALLGESFILSVFVPFMFLGMLISLIRVRHNRTFWATVAACVFVLPTAISNMPEYAIRNIGAFGFVALLAGYGIERVLALLRFYTRPAWQIVVVCLIIAIGSMGIGNNALRRHFQFQRSSYDVSVDYGRSMFDVTFQYLPADIMAFVLERDAPTYLPLAYLNEPHAYRLFTTHEVAIYTGESLPDGMIVLPTREQFFKNPTFMQYGLVAGGRIIILPPIALAEGRTLEAHVYAEGGKLFVRDDAFVAASYLPIRGDDWQFDAPTLPDTPLAVFGGDLELLYIQAPQELEYLPAELAEMPGEGQADRAFPVTLYWRAKQNTATNYFVSLQSYDYQENTQGIHTAWIHRYLYPTVRWQTGEVVPQSLWITTYRGAPEGAYRFLVGVYVPPAHTYVPVIGESTRFDGTRLVAGQTRIPFGIGGDAPAPPLAMPAVFANGLLLEGADLALLQDSILTLTLDWRVQTPVHADYTLFAHLVESGQVVAQEDKQAFEGKYPTSFWHIQDAPQTQHRLQMPADSQDRTFEVKMGMYHPLTQERVPLAQGGIESKNRLVCLFQISVQDGQTSSIKDCGN